MTESAAPHDFLNLAGGAIGSMMAVSIGAGIACPDRKVVTLQGDGSAMYILQSLWTQARESVDVVTVIYANRGYRILSNELKRLGSIFRRCARSVDVRPAKSVVGLGGVGQRHGRRGSPGRIKGKL